MRGRQVLKSKPIFKKLDSLQKVQELQSDFFHQKKWTIVKLNELLTKKFQGGSKPEIISKIIDEAKKLVKQSSSPPEDNHHLRKRRPGNTSGYFENVTVPIVKKFIRVLRDGDEHQIEQYMNRFRNFNQIADFLQGRGIQIPSKTWQNLKRELLKPTSQPKLSNRLEDEKPVQKKKQEVKKKKPAKKMTTHKPTPKLRSKMTPGQYSYFRRLKPEHKRTQYVSKYTKSALRSAITGRGCEKPPANTPYYQYANVLFSVRKKPKTSPTKKKKKAA